jgi:hypothetical protein
MVQDLLASMATWHAYAKLRLHTEDTLASFQKVTLELGKRSAEFARLTARDFETIETPAEASASARRAAQRRTSSKISKHSKERTLKKKKKKVWNINAYKYHALGDYPWMIPEVGTTDSHTTQIVSLMVLYVTKFLTR